jgi:SulP family sulfate permease
MIVVTTLTTGLFFILLGVFKLGGFVRFLPYSVIGGFLAGTGWLLTIGGVGVMVEMSPPLAMFHPGLLIRWLPGLILGLVILVAVNRYKSPLALPAAFAAGLGAFYIVAWVTRTPFTELSAQGWLLGAFPSGSLWRFPLQAEILSQANWPVIAGQAISLAPILIVSTIALLLNANSLELIIKKDVDLNRELVTAGIGNLAAVLGGGIVGYHTISLSSLNHSLSGGKRLPGLILAALLGLTIIPNVASLLTFIPKMILGALLVFVGLAMLFDWVYQAWFKFPKSEFVIIVVILLVVAVRGFLEAIALGLVLAVVLFVVNYSRVSVVKQELCGNIFRSRVTRSRSQWEALTARGDELCVLKLQGFIFFGTANSLFEQVRERTRRTDVPPVRYVVQDFAQVTGLDSTALLSFAKLLQLAQEQRFTLVLTGLSGRASQQFARAGFQAQPGALQLFGDLDHGIEWCEDQILATVPVEAELECDLQAQLAAILPGDERRIEVLITHLKRREIATGDYLVRQGDEPDMMYFIESGKVTARLETPGEEPVRLETMGGGRTVGELGFFLGIKRTAAVVADQPSVVYSISKEVLAQMEKADPEAANTFHRIIVHLLGERTVHLIRTVDALQP